MFAAWQGHVEAVKVLLSSGADINAKYRGSKTALMGAEERGQAKAAQRAGAPCPSLRMRLFAEGDGIFRF